MNTEPRSIPLPIARPNPDWEAVELNFRAGIKSLRQIAGEHGITEGAVRKRARRDGWLRDLGAKIHAKADELVRNEAVRTEVRAGLKVGERAVVDANAQNSAAIQLGHRKNIGRARAVVNHLLDELESQTQPDTLALLRDLGDVMRLPDDAGRNKLNDIYKAVISLPERARTMKTLAESLRITIELERAAFGMDRKQPGEGGADGAAPMRPMTDTERAVRLAHIINSLRAGRTQELPA